VSARQRPPGYIRARDLIAMAIIAAGGSALAWTQPWASADSVGAGVQVAPVRVTVPAGATQRARVMVQDTGSATETLTITGGRYHDEQILPFGWVRRTSVTTAPGAWRTVTFSVAVPPGTPPGKYRRYVGASTAPGGPAGAISAAFGAGSYTNLVITVVPPVGSNP